MHAVEQRNLMMTPSDNLRRMSSLRLILCALDGNLKALPQSRRSFAVMSPQLLDCFRRRGHLWPRHPAGPLSERWPRTGRFSLRERRTPSATLFLAHGCRNQLRVSRTRPPHRFRPHSACRSSTMPQTGSGLLPRAQGTCHADCNKSQAAGSEQAIVAELVLLHTPD